MEPLAIRKVQKSRSKPHHSRLGGKVTPRFTLRDNADYLCKSTCRRFKSEAHLRPAVPSKCHQGPAIVPIPPSIY